MSENNTKHKKSDRVKTTLIGGQALLEGVMMRGKTAMAMAVRGENGIIQLETERIKPKSKIAKVPVIRGVVAFVNSLVLGIKTLTRSATVLTPEDEKPLSKGMVSMSVVIALLIAVGLFFALPTFLAGLFYDHVYKNALVKNLISGVIRISLFVGYICLVSLMKDINRTFMYHGAEHKTINCYEKGLNLSVENVQSCSKVHNRCGTTFIFFVMTISILTFAFLDLWLYHIINYGGFWRNITLTAAHLSALPLVAGLSFEMLQGLAKLNDNGFTKIIRAPGLALQKLTTKEPDDGMVEVAIKSFSAVLSMDENPQIPARLFNQVPFAQAKALADGAVKEIGAEEAESDWILCEILGVSRSGLSEVKFITAKDEMRLIDALKKRAEMPLDYVFEKSNFYGINLFVTPDVLIPRMDTEVLAETAIAFVGETKARVLDLCTGSGCIAAAIAANTNAEITASDVSENALKIAAKNLEDKGAEVVLSDLFAALNGRVFDLIVCNPPYIPAEEMDGLQWEVACQPRIALFGGEDGLDFYRRIALNAKAYMTSDAVLMLEVGYNQAESVEKLLLSVGGFSEVKRIKDLSGIERVIIAR